MVARSHHGGRFGAREALGFGVFALGVFLLLAFVSHNPYDYDYRRIDASTYRNLAGPIGIVVSHVALRALGVVSALWAIGLTVWGFALLLGHAVWPGARRLTTLVVMSLLTAILVPLVLPETLPISLPSGLGGLVGGTIATGLEDSVGRALGAGLVGLLMVATLVVTGDLQALVDGVTHAFSRDPDLIGGEIDADTLDGAGRQHARIVRPRGASGPAADSLDELMPDFSSAVPRHDTPAAGIFRRSTPVAADGNALPVVASELEAQLREFKVEGRVTAITQGPVVTTVEYEPAPGMKVAKIVSLADDLARLLKAQSLRVFSPVPGKNTVGFEIPNPVRQTIRFGDLLGDPRFRAKDAILPIALGVDTFGKPVVADLADMPHLLIAGTTGAGKSVFLNSLVASLVYTNTAKRLRFVMVDPKMIELAGYGDLPHLACPVVTDARSEAQAILNALVDEMESRFRQMGAVGARNIQAFNDAIRFRRKGEFPAYEGKWQSLPYVVLIVDEFADLILLNGKETEAAITRLAQKARAAGIHLVIATQRPSVSVVTGLIKANFTTRVAFRVLSGTDSRTILDQGGAETLLGKGDLIFQSAGGSQRLHGALLDDVEVAEMVRACV
jgi:hypothetical protein